MALVIVAGVLGVITICGGLFLRRLLGELAELRRQITRFDRQMRAQRARENFLRQLLLEDEEDDDGDGDEPPPQKAVVNGHTPVTDPAPAAGRPVRCKGHLGLYIGGAVAALAAINAGIRQVLRYHGAQVTAAVTGVAVTAATVTLITVQPWSKDDDGRPPTFAPTALPTAAYTPPHIPHQPTSTPSSNPTVTPSDTADPSPGGSSSPSPWASIMLLTPSGMPPLSGSEPSRAKPSAGRGRGRRRTPLPRQTSKASPAGRTHKGAPPGRSGRPGGPGGHGKPSGPPGRTENEPNSVVFVGAAVGPDLAVEVSVLQRG
ncbi:hypothetical protein ACVB8X_14250 [Streptomyces sp. NRAIS4]